MAAIFILAGGIFGFASALVSMVLLGTGVLATLSIWSAVGLFFFLAGVVAAQMPGRANPAGSQPVSTAA